MTNTRTNYFPDDKNRPTYHFMPPKNWMNDPNGLIHWKGKYHLFYQHNPNAPVWGDIHWGHAISDDLIHWQDMPIALAPTPNSPDERGVWSGCTIDNDGVATIFYTGARGEHHDEQTVCIATSTDDDLTLWQKYEQNPVIAAPPKEFEGCGFRDPYVFKHNDTWLMVIGAGIPEGGEAVLLYKSDDLYNWTYLHPLMISNAKNDFAYECPSFLPITDDKWMLIVSLMPESSVQYFVGTFENYKFTPTSSGRLADGAFYAPLAFIDDQQRRLLMGWIRETRPIAHSQSAGWAGVASLPLEITLKDSRPVLAPIRGLLPPDRAVDYWEFTNVTFDKLDEIETTIDTRAIKVVSSEYPDWTVYIDHSVIEAFSKHGHYRIMRDYNRPGIYSLQSLFSFPLGKVSIWKIANIWD